MRTALLPPISYPPLPKHSLTSKTVESKKLITHKLLQGERHDKRNLREIRPIHMQTGYLHDASGSAYFKLGETKIICTVTGPRPSGKATFSENAEINLDISSIIPPTNNSTDKSVEENKKLTHLLLEAVESLILLSKYPKASIDMAIIIVEDRGGVLDAALSCISLALIDAQIEVIDLCVGISAFAYSDPSHPSHTAYLLDVDDIEEDVLKKSNTFTALHIGLCLNQSTICFLNATGPHLSHITLEKLTHLAEAAGEGIGNQMKKFIQSNKNKYNEITQT